MASPVGIPRDNLSFVIGYLSFLILLHAKLVFTACVDYKS
jgi:hypothetical protein